MTRPEFEAFMEADGWSPLQRSIWRNVTPTVDAATFRRELKRADGMIEVNRFDKPRRSAIGWLRGLLKAA